MAIYVGNIKGPQGNTGAPGNDGAQGPTGNDGASVNVVLVPAASWPPAADPNPLNWYVKVP